MATNRFDQLPLALDPFATHLAKSCRDDDQSFDAVYTAFFGDVVDVLSWNADDRAINGGWKRSEVRPRVYGVDRSRSGVHRIDWAGESMSDEIRDYLVTDGVWLSRCADDRDRRWF
jgi:hypothetical protein